MNSSDTVMTLFVNENGDMPSEAPHRKRDLTIGELRRLGLETRFDRRQKLKMIQKILNAESKLATL